MSAIAMCFGVRIGRDYVTRTRLPRTRKGAASPSTQAAPAEVRSWASGGGSLRWPQGWRPRRCCGARPINAGRPNWLHRYGVSPRNRVRRCWSMRAARQSRTAPRCRACPRNRPHHQAPPPLQPTRPVGSGNIRQQRTAHRSATAHPARCRTPHRTRRAAVSGRQQPHPRRRRRPACQPMASGRHRPGLRRAQRPPRRQPPAPAPLPTGPAAPASPDHRPRHSADRRTDDPAAAATRDRRRRWHRSRS